jgi:Carboxymuconolactone decarboxylase family
MRMSAPTSYSQSVVVPLPADGDIRAVIGEGYDPDNTLNVIKMFAGTGEFYPVLTGMVRAIFGTPDIDAKHREMIILRAASILDVPYEWQANRVMASNAGLTEAEIEATTSEGPVSGVAPEYILICTATDELLRTGTLTDDTLSAMLDMFGPVVTRKYSVTIAWFSMLSLFLNATRTPLETTDKIGSRTSPLG